jgi:hypothetical protein
MIPPHLVIESPDDMMAAIYKNKTPGERLHVAFGLWTSTRILLEGILRAQHLTGMTRASGRKSPGECLMEQLERLRHAARCLDKHGIRYFVTGAVAAIA